jgi:1-deoxy-D-xylulose-5-phosphate synthase
MILDDSINHEKISNMTLPELKELCRELRRCILNTVSENGGHLASNLGTVELTAALHFVFDVKEDRIVWDVGHQAYAHKLLTGRYSEFSTLRSLNGISGFTRRKESTADAFISGHSSTSISAAFGIASAMRLQGRRGSVAAVIGDGALTGGMAYEGLNNAGKSKAPLVVILNDNAMSISKSTGALALYLAHIRSTKKYYCAKEHVKSLLSAVPVVGDKLERTIRTAKGLIKDAIYDSSNMFENFGFQYIGPVNGHDLEDLIEALQVAKIMRQPCVVHVFTTKGKGWKPAEENPGEYHAVTKKSSAPSGETFTEAFGRELERIGKSDSRVCGITAAMKYATGMNYFKNACPERFFDVGIAEQHAVTFAAGLAVEGMLPVFAVYSTFLQRGFDQIVHDCAIENTHVTLAVDRAGFTGEDGETHQGIFDAAMLASIPNTTVFSPASAEELRLCLSEALYNTDGIAAVRYPKGGESGSVEPSVSWDWSGKRGGTLAVSYGRLSANMTAAAREASQRGEPVDWLRLVRISPIPEEALRTSLSYKRVVFFEEGILQGGIGERFGAALLEMGYSGGFEVVGVDGQFVPAGTVAQQLELFGLDRASMSARLTNLPGGNHAT